MKQKDKPNAVPTPAPAVALSNPAPAAAGLQNMLVWLLMLFAFGLYINTLGHQYAFDDSIVITDNKFTQKGLAGIKELATQDFFNGIYGEKGMELTGGRYRPLSLVMFAVEQHYFPNQAWIGHFINVLFYSLSVGLLFVWLKRLFSQPHFSQLSAVAVGLVASLWFAAHPVHTEIVANIKSRDEIMCLFFLLLSLINLDKIGKGQGTGLHYALAAGCFMLGLLSKENAIVFVLLYPALLWAFYPQAGGKIASAGGLLLLVGLAYLALRHSLVGGVGAETNPDVMENPFVGQSIGNKLGTIGLILGKYLLLMIMPYKLSCDYSYNQIPFVGLGDVGGLAAWALYLLAGGYSVWALSKKNWIGWPILLYLLPLGLVCNLLFNVGAPMADRFLYLSSVGFCMAAAAWLLQKAKVSSWEDFLKHKLLIAVILLITAALSYKTISRNPAWYNNESLFGADVKNSPNSAKIHYYYGNTMLKKYLENPQAPDAQKSLDLAEKHMLTGFKINPKFPSNTYNVGLVYWNKENGQLAEQYLLELLKYHPTHIMGNELLGKVYGRFLNNPQKAVYHLERAIYEFKSPNVDNLRSLAIVYAQQNQLDKALDLSMQALNLDPNDGITWQNLAALYSARGEAAKAAEAAAKAQQLRK